MRRGLILLVSVVAAAPVAQWAASRGLAQPRDERAAAVGPQDAHKSVEAARRAKLAAAKEAYELLLALNERGAPNDRPEMEDRYQWSRRWMEAERDCAADDAGRRQAAAAHLGRMKKLLDVLERLHNVGRSSVADVVAVRYFVAEAEQWVAETADQKGR